MMTWQVSRCVRALDTRMKVYSIVTSSSDTYAIWCTYFTPYYNNKINYSKIEIYNRQAQYIPSKIWLTHTAQCKHTPICTLDRLGLRWLKPFIFKLWDQLLVDRIWMRTKGDYMKCIIFYARGSLLVCSMGWGRLCPCEDRDGHVFLSHNNHFETFHLYNTFLKLL